VSEARSWIDFDHPELSVREQCRLLGLHRSNVYYDPAPESKENLRLMRMMDEEHLKRPHRGSRQMVDFFADRGIVVNRKKVQRLMRKMGIEGLSPRRRTTLRREGRQVYPYLLRNLEIRAKRPLASHSITSRSYSWRLARVPCGPR
jgi:putative transposase